MGSPFFPIARIVACTISGFLILDFGNTNVLSQPAARKGPVRKALASVPRRVNWVERRGARLAKDAAPG